MCIEDKTALRRHLRRVRKNVPARQRCDATNRINRFLYRIIRRGERIGVYWAVGSELNLHDFINKAQRRGALVYLPYMVKGQQRLWFTAYPAHTHRAQPATISETRGRKHSNKRLKAKNRKYPTHAHNSLLMRRSTPAIPQFKGKKIRAHALQTLIVPLLGVDQQGFRLGQGGGFYDVTLAHTCHRLHPQCIGVGFACQQVARLPVESHDQKLDAFVCEHGWQQFTKYSM